MGGREEKKNEGILSGTFSHQNVWACLPLPATTSITSAKSEEELQEWEICRKERFHNKAHVELSIISLFLQPKINWTSGLTKKHD